MGVKVYEGDNAIRVLRPKWTEEEIASIVTNRHSWLGGLVKPKSLKFLEVEDTYVPYIITGVKYYQKIGQPRRCYVFENLEKGLKSGVIGIENLEFIERDPPSGLESISIDEERHAADIAHYCNLELLVKNYRKFINWQIDILEVQVVYRQKRNITYMVNGKLRTKEIFVDGVVLK